MAQLTWRNVAAPDFSGVASSQAAASAAIQNSMKGLSDALTGFQKTRTDAADAAYLAQIGKYSNVDDYNAAVASGAVNPNGASVEAIKAGMAQRDQLLANQTRGIQNTGLGIANNTNQFNLNKAQLEEQQAQARLAAQPAAAKLLADVQTLAGSGDPAQVEKARTMLSGNTQTLLNAGYKADAIPGLLDAARTTGTAGFGYKKSVLEDQKFWENQGISDQARTLATGLINDNATPEMAIRSIQNDQSIKDPRIKAQAIGVIRQAADANVFAAPDQVTTMLSSMGVQPGSVVTNPAGSAVPANAGPRQSGNALIDLVDKTEGGGSYDTLYGHAQRGNSPFAGVAVSKMTLDQLSDLDKSYGPYVKNKLAEQGHDPRIATPMGRFQIVGDTRRQAAKEMGLPGNTVFTPEVQNAMFNHLADQRLSGPRTMEGKMASLRQEWEGFKGVKDSVLAAAITAYENGDRSALTGATGSPTSAPAYPGSSVQMPGITMPVGTSPAAQLTAAVTAPTDPVQAPAAATTPSPTRETFTNGQDYEGIARQGSPLEQAIAARQASQAPVDPESVPGGYASIMYGRNTNDAAAQLTAAASQSDSPAVNPAISTAPAASNNTQAPAQSLATPGQQAQAGIDQALMNRVFNGNGYLINQIVDPQYQDMTPAQIADRLVGDGGPMPGGNKLEILQAIKDTQKLAGGNMSPAIAGAIVANNAESADLRPWYNRANDWIMGRDRFNTPDGAAVRTNMDGVKNDLAALGKNVAGAIDISKGTSAIANQRTAAVGMQQLGQVQAAILSVDQQIAQVTAQINQGRNVEANNAELARLLQQKQQLAMIVNQISKNPGPTTNFVQAANSVPQ